MKNTIITERLITTILMALLLLAVLWGLSRGIDKSMQNQDIMLCESAKKSGNTEWLNKCETYYITNNIGDVK